MKKQVLFLLSFILVLSIVSAAGVEIDLNKEEFYQGEVLQAEIAGAFIEGLQLSNIAIYLGDKVHPTPTASSNLIKTGNKYLYYAVLPYTVGNYSLQIRDVKYYVGQDKSEDIVYSNFTIVSTLDPYLSANKGFISASDDFEITIKSLNAIQEVTVTFDGNGESLTKEIGYNSEKTFKFTIDDIEEYIEATLTAGDLSIPVFVYPRTPPPEPFINGTESDFADNDSYQEPEPEEITLEEATTEQIQTCADINGQICLKGYECKGPTSYAEGIVCCTGECVEKTSSSSWIVGVILILILVGAAAWFYYQSKKKAESTEGQESVKEKAEKYRKRLHPSIKPGPEARRSLSRE